MMREIPWPPVVTTQRIVELEDLRRLVQSVSEQEEYAPHLNRYLVVRSAGLVESVRDDVAGQHAQITSSARTHRRILSGLGKGEGVSPEQLTQFLGSFDTDWAVDLREWLREDESERSNRLGALVAARRQIAHGSGASVRRDQALIWADVALETASWLIERLDPTKGS
jgi:hypothetical protein